MRSMRFFVLAGALALTGVASPAAAQQHATQALDSAALVTRFPEMLVYEGVARVRGNDYAGAILAWHEYLAKTNGRGVPVDSATKQDRALVAKLIAHAREQIRKQTLAAKVK